MTTASEEINALILETYGRVPDAFSIAIARTSHIHDGSISLGWSARMLVPRTDALGRPIGKRGMLSEEFAGSSDTDAEDAVENMIQYRNWCVEDKRIKRERMERHAAPRKSGR